MSELPLDPIAIDVGHLLQRTVASLYSHLVTRQTGRAVRMAIETQLAEVGERSLSLIDLSEVTVLDFSCADEVVAKLLQNFARADHTEAFFVFRGVHEPHRHQIEVVLQRQALAAVVEGAPGRFELLGARSSAEGEVWGTLEEMGMVAKEQISNVFVGDEAREALERLATRRLAFRSPITGRYHALSRLVEHLT
jgi:anti-anti-sigma regulatory factor